MNSNRIANRINDLLKMTGITDKQTLEELSDHYLTHIEEEVKRGVNSQKAVRETFQEIANIDISNFEPRKKTSHRKWLILITLILLGLGCYFNHSPKETLKKDVVVETQQISKNEINKGIDKTIAPPKGFPIQQSEFDITSEFGFRIHPIRKQKQLHKGIDIRAKKGTPVLSTGEGKILEAGYKEKAGKYISIQHPGNYITKYYHLSDISVVAGVEVQEGQEIGKVGSSGLSLNPHLHYEILKNEVPVNPREILKP